MTTASDLLLEIQRCGGRLEYRAPDELIVDLPARAAERLMPILRERKSELLRLLTVGPFDVCATCGSPVTRWLDGAGVWRCAICEPAPSAPLWRGLLVEDLGDRYITLQPPTSDLPRAREWVMTPLGWGTVVCWRIDAGEVLVKLFHPRQGSRPWRWFAPQHVDLDYWPKGRRGQ